MFIHCFYNIPKYDGYTILCNIYFNTHLYTWTMELYIRYTVMKLMCDLPYILCAIDLFFAPHTSDGFYVQLLFVCTVVLKCLSVSKLYDKSAFSLTWHNFSDEMKVHCQQIVFLMLLVKMFLFTKHDKMAASVLNALHKYLSTMCCNNVCIDFCFPNVGRASFIYKICEHIIMNM